jgi:hypothetical protein
MTTDKNTKNILTIEEHEQIVNMFPEKMRNIIKKCNDPLDETQLLVSLFSDKKVRIILKKELNDFGNEDYVSYFHVNDIAEQVKYNIKHINHWINNWKVKFIKHKNLINLPLQNTSPNYFEINFTKKIDYDANFINGQDLKKVLTEIKNNEAKLFQQWILKQSTVMNAMFKKVIEIKHKLELENKDKIIKQQQDENTKLLTEIERRTREAVNFYREPVRSNGYIYIASSADLKKIDAYKIGLTTKTTKERVASMKTSNPDMEILSEFKCSDVHFTEHFIHSFLNNLRVFDKNEFFFSYSEERCNEFVGETVEIMNNFINKYTNDHLKLQTIYINDPTKKIILSDNKRPHVKHNEKKTEIINKSIAINDLTIETNIFKQYIDKHLKPADTHIHTKTIYEHFCIWYKNNNTDALPSSKKVFSEFKKYNIIAENNIHLNNKNSYGIKNYQIID